MDDNSITLQQARAIASLLPALIRQLFVLENDLAAELPLAQLRVCGILYAGARPMSALGREMGVSQSAMTQIADRLERAELVQRVAEGSDRRVRCLQLTERGTAMMRLRENARVQRVWEALEHLALHERSRVLAALELLMGACAESRESRVKSREPEKVES